MNLFNNFSLKDFVYVPVFSNTGQPMFFSKDGSLKLKCFYSIQQSDNYSNKLVEEKLVKDEKVLVTEHFNLESLLEFCNNIANAQKKQVVVELWDKKKDIDVGPFVLYNSEALPN